MRLLNELKIWVSPLTGLIYAGYTSKGGERAVEKVEITDFALSAVAEHLDKEDTDMQVDFPQGTLIWRKKGEISEIEVRD